MSPKDSSLPVDSPLARLLSTHDNPRHSGFITLVDRSSLSRKRMVFTKSLILNVGLLPLMTWLAYIIVMRDMFTTRLEMVPMTAFYLAQDVIIIWAIFSLFVNTTIPFFFGECYLRLRCGFRPIEVVFLSLPNFDSSLPDDMHFEHYQRLATCADPYLSYTSFQPSLIRGTSCVVTHSAILDAYKLIDSGEIDVDQLDSVVWMRGKVIWGVCQLCKVEEKV